MSRWSTGLFRIAAPLGAAICLIGVLAAAQPQSDVVAGANAAGWQVPPQAPAEKSPLDQSPGVLRKGKDLFSSTCEKCHGASGRGDGRYGDPQHPPADLTASTTAEGVVFYKVWNGRTNPLMPPFKSMMTREEIWTVIEYVKTLRHPAAP